MGNNEREQQESTDHVNCDNAGWPQTEHSITHTLTHVSLTDGMMLQTYNTADNN